MGLSDRRGNIDRGNCGYAHGRRLSLSTFGDNFVAAYGVSVLTLVGGQVEFRVGTQQT
jgi:hypothetical protein